MSQQTRREDRAMDAPTASPPRWPPRGYPIPTQPKQNPTDWSERKLERYGLPPRPDKYRHPDLYRLWIAAFGKKLRFIQFQTEGSLDVESYPPPPSNAVGLSTSRFEKSRNWSGVYIEPSAGRTFVQVWGQWTVPAPRPPTQSPESCSYRCATWIGLDGHRRYRNSSLPQIGTLQRVDVEGGKRKLKFHAWVQWWHRTDCEQPGPVTIDDFPIRPGNVISCVLTVLDKHSVLLNIVNQSTSLPNFAAVRAFAPAEILQDGGCVRPCVSGATAEWIMERPGIPGEKALYCFPDYGSVDFVDCCAVEAFKDGVSPVPQIPRTPRFIRMYEVREAPQRTAYISMPKRINATSFNVTYCDSRD